MARVLIVAAHPDDEILGVGATAARHAANGDDVSVLIVAEGATSRDSARDAVSRDGELSALRASANAAAKVLGTRQPRFGGLPDNRLDQLPLLDVVKLVESMTEELDPDVVYTHHASDLNIDHRIVHQAVLTACRPLPAASCRQVFAFETVSSTEWGSPFVPTHFVSAERFLDLKVRALECYASEMRAFPHPRSPEAVRALAVWRGASVGVPAAEAFVTVRTLVR